MITCPACGKENDDSAFECRRCRAPLRDELPPEDEAPAAEAAQHTDPGHPAAAGGEASSRAFGTVCPACEAYNEPGVETCTSCGAALFAEAPAAADPSLDHTPPQPFVPPDATPPDGVSPVNDELDALALSPEEAAEAMGNGSPAHGFEEPPLDKTPAQPYAPPADFVSEDDQPTPAPRRPSAAAAAVSVAAPSAAQTELPPPPPPPAPKAVEAPAPSEKLCASCGAGNPPAAKFCFDCGTPFAKKAPAAPPPESVKIEPVKLEPVKIEPVKLDPVKLDPVKIEPLEVAAPIQPLRSPEPEPEPSIQIPDDLTAETPPVSEALHAEAAAMAEAQVAAAEEPQQYEEAPADAFQDAEAPAAEAYGDAPYEESAPLDAGASEEPTGESVRADPSVEILPGEGAVETGAPLDDTPAPYAASLVVEKGASPGTAYLLSSMENRLGAEGQVQLDEDPFVAPHAATLLFAEDRLVLRDEGSANGVYVKVREAAPLEPGDFFAAGERLFRYDGPVELQQADTSGDTPLLGAPRPQGPVTVRVAEILAGGRTGRTCHRSGPAIGIGRTGCDMNFPADALLGPRHAELRIGEDGSAQLVDLGQGPSGVWLRLRQQQTFELQAGDLVQLGDQQLRVEVG